MKLHSKTFLFLEPKNLLNISEENKSYWRQIYAEPWKLPLKFNTEDDFLGFNLISSN